MDKTQEEQKMDMSESKEVTSINDLESKTLETIEAEKISGQENSSTALDQPALDSLSEIKVEEAKDIRKKSAFNKQDISSNIAHSPEPQTSSACGSKDMGISALIHLLGLPTSGQVGVLEGRIDALEVRISSLILKLEKLSAHFEKSVNDSALDRIDFQLSDARALLKKIAGSIAIGGLEPDEQKKKGDKHLYRVMSSHVSDKKAKAVLEANNHNDSETKTEENKTLVSDEKVEAENANNKELSQEDKTEDENSNS